MTPGRSWSSADRSRLASRLGVAALVLCCVAVAVAALLRWPGPAPASVAVTDSAGTGAPAAGSLSQRPAVLFVGDSYTAGTGADSPDAGYACQTARALRWTCLLDAQGSTGYLSDGHAVSKKFTPLADRLAADARSYRPDVVVIDAGRNDGGYAGPVFLRAVSSYLKAVHETFPRARLVLIVPAFVSATTQTSPYGSRLAEQMRQLARPYDALVIDPLAEDWYDGVTTKAYTVDKIHPNQAGHDLIAKRLTADLLAAGLGRLTAPVRSF